MTESNDIKEYYRQITELDIIDIARELLVGRITQETPKYLLCDCPQHQSQSHRSLQIMTDKQGWYCFGCGVGGDVLQLVEFIKTGKVTTGCNGTMPDSHRAARDFLAQKAGLPPLSNYGMSKEQLEQTEKERAFETRVKEALTALARFYNERLKANPEVLNWLKTKYAINDEAIDSLLIGYADNSTGVIKALTAEGFTLRELAAGGAFRPTSQDGLYPFFDKRIIFPYWSRSRVAFMIGRQTPWTPKQDWEQSKYKKLPVHDDQQRPYIAKFINNSLLYNEDLLMTKPNYVIITEGVTDCISLMQQGLPVISPVTVRIRESDWKRLISKLRNVKTVYICQDNEISQAGLKGALQTACVLAEHNIDSRLVSLPLSSNQIQAREELRNKFEVDITTTQNDLLNAMKNHTPAERQDAEKLLAAAKIDVNDFFISGHNKEDFIELLKHAQTPLEHAISNIPDASGSKKSSYMEPIMAEIAAQSIFDQESLLLLVHEKIGKRITFSALKEHIKTIQKKCKAELPKDKEVSKPVSIYPPGSCRAAIDEVVFKSEELSGSPDYIAATKTAYEWFSSHGAQFFYTQSKEPFMYFSNEIYWMDSSDRGRKRHYSSMLLDQVELPQISNIYKVLVENMSNLALLRGQQREHFTWLHTDINNYTVYFNLNNKDHEIAKITPDGIEIIKNGSNADGIILDCSRKMKPLKFLPDASIEEADQLLMDLLINNFSCSQGDKFLILSWLSCFLLIDFSGIKPMTRFEGSAGSGKTTASKLISALIYGEPQQKKATDAANYTDGSQNPLIILDNIEVKQMTDELITFMLTSITGIAKEKRKSGTDSETITERTKCLLNTTGIEPLCGELSEIQSRAFVVNFEIANQSNSCFLESDIIGDLQQNRNLIISAIMKRTCEVLAMMRDGKRKQVMNLLHTTLGSHDKQRCNEYLSMMYLMMLAGSPPDEVDKNLQTLAPFFKDQITFTNQTSRETAHESNHTATALATFFKAWENAVKADEDNINDRRINPISEFINRYQIKPDHAGILHDVLSRELFVALKRISRDFGLRFDMDSARQFAQRMANDLETGLATFLWTFFIVYPVAIFCSLNSAGERYPNVE